MALRPPRLAPVVLAALLLLLPASPGASAAPASPPAERVDAAELVAATEHHGSILRNLSTVESMDAAVELVAEAGGNASRVLDALQDLDARDGDLLGNYWEGLRGEVRTGNLSDVRSLARAARGLLDDELLPQLRSWAGNGTFLTPGNAQAAAGGATRVPVLLFHPPPGGVGAFDLEVRVDPDAVRVAGAEAAVGQGEATVDAGNGSARVASFDARALGNLDSGGVFVTLAHVTVEPRSGGDVPVVLDVHVRELVRPDGTAVPAVTSPGQVVVGDDVAIGASPTVAVALVVVALLGVGAAWAARRFLEV